MTEREIIQHTAETFTASKREHLVRIGDWNITLDLVDSRDRGKLKYYRYRSQVYVQVKAAFMSRDGFRFAIRSRTGLRRAFRMRGIETGYRDIDGEFITKSNDVSKARLLCADNRMRHLVHLHRQNYFCLKIRAYRRWFGARFAQDVDELYLAADSFGEVARLECILELAYRIMNKLREIGSASIMVQQLT